MTFSELESATTYMWGAEPQIFDTKIEGIYDTDTVRHGGYLVDCNLHPELSKYGTKTNIPGLRAFEEDYEALKVLWVFPELIKDPNKAKEWLTKENVIKYDNNDNFLKDFPENPIEKLNNPKIEFLNKEFIGGYNDTTTYNIHLKTNGKENIVLAERQCFDSLEGTCIWSIVEEKDYLTEKLKRDIISNYLDEPVYREYINNTEITVNYSDISRIFGTDIEEFNKGTIIPLAKHIVDIYFNNPENPEFKEFLASYKKDESDYKLINKLNEETKQDNFKSFKNILGIEDQKDEEEDTIIEEDEEDCL